MKFLSLIFILIINCSLFAQNPVPDSLDKQSSRGLERFFRATDVKSDITEKPGRTYINHYQYRMSLSPSITFLDMKGNNSTWNTNSSVQSFSIDFKISLTIKENHKLNLSISPGLYTTSDKIFYTSTWIQKEQSKLDVSVFSTDLGYSYLYPVSDNNYIEAGAGARLLLFDSNDKQIQIKDINFSYYLNLSYLRRLSENYNLFMDISYSGHEMHPTAIKKDRLSIDMLQFKIGLQFLTIVSDMFYNP